MRVTVVLCLLVLLAACGRTVEQRAATGGGAGAIGGAAGATLDKGVDEAVLDAAE